MSYPIQALYTAHTRILLLWMNAQKYTLFGGAKVSTGFGTVEVACRAAWQARKTPRNFL